MDGFIHSMDWFGFPFFGFGMLFWWLLFIVIGFLVYRDANERGMNGPLWFILVILPMIGIVFLLLYIVIRESKAEKTPLEILKERYAKGEITKEEYLRMKKELEG
ncbi:putative membrane protein [Archaeoglobus sulfaticallidus PM70-1]|uniref:Putative membrane protein n=1 Tax=Archaeoglobus sulfaticallidus PM70-1 TaxID=387631 RepID=N0BBB1_9EURY|nr:SHOCT domain-containing protein [Archaeoglobus sulfaticallidus]AGK60298.1 putative membrane protein [Archaeoglobus sulfaticallidus PM70-1]